MNFFFQRKRNCIVHVWILRQCFVDSFRFYALINQNKISRGARWGFSPRMRSTCVWRHERLSPSLRLAVRSSKMATARNDSDSDAGSFTDEGDYVGYFPDSTAESSSDNEKDNNDIGVRPYQFEPEFDEDPESLMSVEIDDVQEGGVLPSRLDLPSDSWWVTIRNVFVLGN